MGKEIARAWLVLTYFPILMLHQTPYLRQKFDSKSTYNAFEEEKSLGVEGYIETTSLLDAEMKNGPIRGHILLVALGVEDPNGPASSMHLDVFRDLSLKVCRALSITRPGHTQPLDQQYSPRTESPPDLERSAFGLISAYSLILKLRNGFHIGWLIE